MIFSRHWHLLAQEAELTKALILAGLTSLSSANYDKKGSFYSMFFQLSAGLERLIKLSIIIDHQADNQLKSPTDKVLRGFGHKLSTGYEHSALIGQRNGIRGNWQLEKDSIEQDALEFLSTFAVGARYYNLDALAGVPKDEDPVAQWSKIHHRIGMAHLASRTRQSIEKSSIQFADKHRQYGWERSIDGRYITQLEGIFLHELFRRSNPHCVWVMLKIMRPFYNLLRELCARAHQVEIDSGITEPRVPHLEEFFPFLLCDRQTALRRKNWINTCS